MKLLFSAIGIALMVGMAAFFFIDSEPATLPLSPSTEGESGPLEVPVVKQLEEVESHSAKEKPDQAAVESEEAVEAYFKPISDEQALFEKCLESSRHELIFPIKTRNRLKEKREELERLLKSIFGHIPENPISEFSKLDEYEVAGFSSEYGWDQMYDLGIHLGELYSTDQILNWFEDSDEISGIRAEIVTYVFQWAVEKKSEKIRASGHLSRRVLSQIEAFLSSSKSHDVSGYTDCHIGSALENICPVQGGLELIRRWVVEKPHGGEIIELSLCEALAKWPLPEATPLVLEVLQTNRVGPIKGIVSLWHSLVWRFESSFEYKEAWGFEEAKSVLEIPLTEAIKKTKSASALLEASMRATKILLKPRLLEIADALMARRDSSYVAAQGFDFLELHDEEWANSRWVEWFNSEDQFKKLVACKAAAGLSAVSKKEPILNQMQSMAINQDNKTSLQSAAARALCQLDSNYDRSIAVLINWLNRDSVSRSIYRTAGLIVIWGPKKDVMATLLSEINNLNKRAEERHKAMFLLATLDPDKAITICEDRKEHPNRLTELTILLVAATAQLMDRSRFFSRGAALREGCSTPEPDWVKRIRQDLDSKEPTIEERIAGSAAVSFHR